MGSQQHLNFYVEPFIRFKFKKLRLNQIKQYKRMHKLEAASKKKKKGGANKSSDSDSDEKGDFSDLDHDQLQQGLKVKLQEIKVRRK